MVSHDIRLKYTSSNHSTNWGAQSEEHKRAISCFFFQQIYTQLLYLVIFNKTYCKFLSVWITMR